MAHIIRFSLSFISFVAILVLAVLFLFFDQKINKFTVIISAVLVVAVIIGVILMIYVIGNRSRLTKFAGWLTHTVNRVVFRFTRGKKRQVVKLEIVENFFGDLHQDYLEIRREKKILIKPLLWVIVDHILDVGLILIAFLALGFWVNPAMLFIAFGLSSIVSVFSGTLGGTGVYEAIMVAFLASAGTEPGIAIAGTLLARVILLAGTILFGFVFYQLTLSKYGKAKH
jgi:uncharacterized protein (TIRG00374 family)